MAELLLGDEAVGLGAIHAGIGGMFGYPGTPSTEIFEYVRDQTADDGVAARWSANEKVAYEEALGMSYVGRRALVCMKHVGLNVAADPMMSSALTGANGGLVLAVADDPGMHSSQNEQDSRYYGQFAQLPLLEPSNQQEAYDMTREAFELSERWGVPVIVRLVTRLCHSRSNVRTRPPAEEGTPRDRVTDWRRFTLLPDNARRRFRRLLDLQPTFQEYSDRSPHNRLELRGPQGIIASGLAYNYVREALGPEYAQSILKIGTYPVPTAMIRELVDHCAELIVVEEGYPFIETHLNGYLGVPGKAIRGKRTGPLPPDGELNADIVRAALGLATTTPPAPPPDLPNRPPQLCGGCPHCDTFKAITEAAGANVRPYLFSDIGCYTLGALPPYNAVDTCVDMGASISMALGAAKAGAHPVLCTIGDSTFIHSGMTGLIGAAHEDANMTVLVLDNATVAMTGGQEVFATGDDLLRVIKGLGVNEKHLITVEPKPNMHEQLVDLLRREIAHRGLSVIIAHRPCIHLKRRTATEKVVEKAAMAS